MSVKVVLTGCLFLFMIFDSKITADTNAVKRVPKLYEEIGCTEIDDDSGVTRFDCPDFTTYSLDKCYLKGKTFNIGDRVEGDILPGCRAACHCARLDDDGIPSIDCANIECPEDLGDRDWSCISTYDNAKECCRTGEICDQAKINAMATCEVHGRKYRIGERIYPDGSCYQCHCTEDYNNKTSFAENPNCARIDCGIELELAQLRAGCVPIYYKEATCCPIEYKCPSKSATDSVTEAVEPSAKADDKNTCKFGESTIAHGEELKTDNKCEKCECSTPPYLTCIRTC